MKITKKPKKIRVIFKEIISYCSEYTCPTCKTTYIGVVNRNVSRFFCKCGQELIINK